jgi:ADP-L-glycero-D-manno-heptose 6-epimerase
MRFALTGTKGFIGGNLAMRLSHQSNDLLEIGEDIFKMENWRQRLVEMLETFKPGFVFHVGANANTLEVNVNSIMLTNFEFTKVLMDWCQSNRVPLVYSSSAAVYGDRELNPSNLYAWSKYVAECYVTSKNGISLRYFNVYGPGEEEKGKMASVFFQAHHAHKQGKTFPLFPGKPRRDFIHVFDVIQANLAVIDNYGNLMGKVFEVGTGNPHSFEEGLEIMNLPITYQNESSLPLGYQFLTSSQSERWLPGWTPKFDLKRGLESYSSYLGRIQA